MVKKDLMVHLVTGTSGSSGSSSITKSETPIGIIDGVNKIFTLLEIPPTSSSYSNSKMVLHNIME
jgi:hypothetical protein